MHVAQNSSTLCARLAVLFFALLSMRSACGQVIEQSNRVGTTSYSGFELPPPSEWTNKSEVVNYTPVDTGADFLILSANFGRQEVPAVPAIDLGGARMKLISSSNSAAVNATASFSELSPPTAYGDPDMVIVESLNEKLDEQAAKFSHYAEVTNQDDLLISRGAAHLSQQNRMDDTSLDASGQLWSESDLLRNVPFGAGSGRASSSISATYYVAEEMDFILSAKLESTQETDVKFSFSGLETSYSTSGDAQHYEWCGTLLPGEYKLNLQAVSKARNLTQHDGVEWDQSETRGGFGEYEISFHAFDVGTDMGATSVVAVPEPSFSALALWTATLSLSIRRRRDRLFPSC